MNGIVFLGPTTCLLWHYAHCLHLFHFRAQAISLFDESMNNSPLK